MIHIAPEQPQKKAPPLDILEVRSRLVLRGLSLRAWAIRNGYWSQVVDHAVRGKRSGPKARRIVRQLKEDLGL